MPDRGSQPVFNNEGPLVAACALDLMPRRALVDAELHEIACMPGPRPARLSALIEAGFAAPPGQTAGWAAYMSLVDRQIALFRLALDFGRWPAWFVTRCECCAKPLDLRVGRDEFTATPAPAPLPARIALPGGAEFAIPCAAHEAALASGADLAATCLLTPGIDPAPLARSFEAELSRILPAFAPELRFPCAECGQETGFWFDPWDWILRHAGQSFDEVHRLARAYGWAETAILSMSQARRRIYLDLLGGTP